MKNAKKLAIVFFAIAMCSLMSIVAFASNSENVTYQATLNTSTITVSENSQTVTMTIKTNKAVDIDGIGGRVIIPDGWTLVSITNDILNIPAGEVNLNNGLISYVSADGENKNTDLIVVVVYNVPASAKVGNYDLGIKDLDISRDYGEEWESKGFVTTTLTIKDACNHENKTITYDAIDNEAKHTVKVTCNDCGEAIGDVVEEACDTVKAKCVDWTCDKCNAEYEATADHNYNNPAHKCACGKVEIFTLTVKDWHTESITIATLEVPYGANLLEYLNDVKVDNINDTNGVYKFVGDWYYYDEDALMDVVISESTMPGKDHTVFAGFSYTGWRSFENGWGYSIDDITLFTGWTFIEGEWYYLDTVTGLRAEGLTRVPYPTEKVNGNTYAPNQEDIDYSVSKDRVFIDKDEAWFLFDEDGKFQSTTTGIIDDIYALNGMIVWHPGVVEFNGEIYYFIGDLENGGNKLAEGDTWVTRNNTKVDLVVGGCYNFENGQLSGISGVVNGKYYENSKLMTSKGLVKLDGGYIYVRSNGEVVVNRDYWITKTNGYSIVNGVYTFDENGYIVDPIDPTVYDGIVNIDGVNYYYENGIKQCCKGVVEITDENGDIYYIYVKSDGTLATGTYWPTNTNDILDRGAYDFGEDGRYYPGK